MVMMIHIDNYHVDSYDNERYEDDDHDNQWCRPIPSVWLQGDIDDDYDDHENGLH